MGTYGALATNDEADGYTHIKVRGELRSVLPTVLSFYTTKDAVDALLGLGDISELGPDLRSCVAYIRDRHERGYHLLAKFTKRLDDIDSEDYLLFFERESTRWYLALGKSGLWVPLDGVFLFKSGRMHSLPQVQMQGRLL